MLNLNLNLLNTPILTPKLNTNNVLEWLATSGLDDEVLDILSSEVKKYPPNALKHYCDNIYDHIKKAQSKVQENRNK